MLSYSRAREIDNVSMSLVELRIKKKPANFSHLAKKLIVTSSVEKR